MTLAIIGGTGLGDLPLESVKKKALQSPWGDPSGPLLCGQLAGCPVVFLNRHGVNHHLPPHRINYRANIDVLASYGVKAVIAINTVGAIDTSLEAGALVAPDQLIDYTWGREHSFSDGSGHPLQHVDFTQPYDEPLRQLLLKASEKQGIPMRDGGVYAVVQGPRLETAAEIRRLERDGCHLVGMTAMPEAGLAREKSLAYASLVLVVNPAAGKGEGDITMEQIREVMSGSLPNVVAVLEQVCGAFNPSFNQSMLPFRQ